MADPIDTTATESPAERPFSGALVQITVALDTDTLVTNSARLAGITEDAIQDGEIQGLIDRQFTNDTLRTLGENIGALGTINVEDMIGMVMEARDGHESDDMQSLRQTAYDNLAITPRVVSVVPFVFPQRDQFDRAADFEATLSGIASDEDLATALVGALMDALDTDAA